MLDGLGKFLLSMNQRDQSTVVEVDGKSLRLTHLSKVMFPDDGPGGEDASGV